ncbi:MAG TPA: hypothetical protein VGC18_15800 [Lacisediminihabitans sp.]|uniref:hypothetical protein n=1 Tax=Lacisediminihabitans sp. TaxID=2787631 RepID=UPI002ED7C28B
MPEQNGDSAQDDETEPLRIDDPDALLSRLRLIEDQPLEQRAAAFTQIHDRLQATLEGETQRPHG